MAIRALPRRYRVGAGQGKASRGVIEPGVKPVVKAVALLAGRGESAGNVVRVRRTLEIGRMTAIALRRQSLELPDRRRFMACVAFQGRVRAQQREPVHVIFDLRNLYVPSLNGVALFAPGAELAFMDVGVAIGAAGSSI